MKYLSFATLTVVALSFVQNISADWSILNLPEASRIELCNRQKGYCTINCGGVDQDPMNFCNPKTMGWGCGCKSKVPDQTAYLWPVVVAECEGKAEDCKMKCLKDNNPNQCYVACSSKFQCRTPNSPPSFLSVSDVNATPLYTAASTPAATKATGSTPSSAANGTQQTKPNDATSLTSVGLGSSMIALVAVACITL
ncbi:hypothetical protein K7432_002990 [Basidiobolus ranarum]|uniref:DUF7707 domain-containing protein n=1 Tax=Basidiobolus ranarum TaxID=34480 RepID=A0ABR2W7A9_9FUNG